MEKVAKERVKSFFATFLRGGRKKLFDVRRGVREAKTPGYVS